MSYRKLGRNSGARKALFSSILTSFFRYGRIETTEAKAKELRKFADKLITLAKRGDLSARRQAIASLADEDVVRKLFDEIASATAAVTQLRWSSSSSCNLIEISAARSVRKHGAGGFLILSSIVNAEMLLSLPLLVACRII